MKTWVDQFGLHSPPATWASVPGAVHFDPASWARRRTAHDFEDESIGLLLAPPPNLNDLADELLAQYRFLANRTPSSNA